ncbi:MAG: hypothetical protein AB7F36_03175 [Reyranellaceae bacterium]
MTRPTSSSATPEGAERPGDRMAGISGSRPVVTTSSSSDAGFVSLVSRRSVPAVAGSGNASAASSFMAGEAARATLPSGSTASNGASSGKGSGAAKGSVGNSSSAFSLCETIAEVDAGPAAFPSLPRWRRRRSAASRAACISGEISSCGGAGGRMSMLPLPLAPTRRMMARSSQTPSGSPAALAAASANARVCGSILPMRQTLIPQCSPYR